METTLKMCSEKNSKTLKLLKSQWEFNEEKEFFYGFLMGDLTGDAFGVARTYLDRHLTKEEIDIINNLAKSYEAKIRRLFYK